MKVVDTIMLKYITLDDVSTDSEFFSYIQDLVFSEPVLQMKQYMQHGTTTTFDHCLNVSYYNYLVCKKFGLNAKAGARGIDFAMEQLTLNVPTKTHLNTLI